MPMLYKKAVIRNNNLYFSLQSQKSKPPQFIHGFIWGLIVKFTGFYRRLSTRNNADKKTCCDYQAGLKLSSPVFNELFIAGNILGIDKQNAIPFSKSSRQNNITNNPYTGKNHAKDQSDIP